MCTLCRKAECISCCRCRSDIWKPSLQLAPGAHVSMHEGGLILPGATSESCLPVPSACGSFTRSQRHPVHQGGPDLKGRFPEKENPLTYVHPGLEMAGCRCSQEQVSMRWRETIKSSKGKEGNKEMPPKIYNFLQLWHNFSPSPTPQHQASYTLKLFMVFNDKEDWNFWLIRTWVDHGFSSHIISVPHHHKWLIIGYKFNYPSMENVCSQGMGKQQRRLLKADTESQWSMAEGTEHSRLPVDCLFCWILFFGISIQFQLYWLVAGKKMPSEMTVNLLPRNISPATMKQSDLITSHISFFPTRVKGIGEQRPSASFLPYWAHSWVQNARYPAACFSSILFLISLPLSLRKAGPAETKPKIVLPLWWFQRKMSLSHFLMPLGWLLGGEELSQPMGVLIRIN